MSLEDFGLRAVLILLVILFFYVVHGVTEWFSHLKNLRKVPIRIVVNGTRGKSTVTRLIAAGMKAGGYKVMAKTTGTKPRMVINNEREVQVIRLGRANIAEQVKIVKKAVEEGIEVLVLENMSLRPDLQIMEESKIVKPRIVVITNVRQDHLDVIGPTLEDMAKYFISAVPDGATIFTAERNLFPLLAELARKRGLQIFQALEEEVSDEEMEGFDYVEHKENVALALKVCEFFGIGRWEALKEMHRYVPDPGVLRCYALDFEGKKVLLYNAMAANDPDSTYLIFERIPKGNMGIYILMNCRSDRVDRSKQMAELVSKKIPAKAYFVTGGSTEVFVNWAKRFGVPSDRIFDLGGMSYEEIYGNIAKVIENCSIIFAIGNIVGFGEGMIEFFLKRSSKERVNKGV